MSKPARILVPLFVAFASLLTFVGNVSQARCQTTQDLAQPYAVMEPKDVRYAGPGREAEYDLRGQIVRIGLVAPLGGPEKADGAAIVAAARLALQDSSREPLPGGLRLELAIGDESVPPWGQFGDVLIHLVVDERAIAVVTSASGVSTHLSEQIGNRIGLPILTLSNDATTTQIDLPWIFRLGPSDTVQAEAIARDIYARQGFTRVLIVTERDHDGRLGGKAFQDAARKINAPPPVSIALDALKPATDSLVEEVKAKSPEAVVIWTDPKAAGEVSRQIREAGVLAPIYLSQEAAQDSSEIGQFSQASAKREGSAGRNVWTVASTSGVMQIKDSFAREYQNATGMLPSSVAAEAYDAVCLIAQSLRQAGPNRARLRDFLAKAQDFSGASGRIAFDGFGNNRAGVRLVPVQ